MKKILVLFIFLTLGINEVSAFCGREARVEFRTAAFFNTSKRFRGIYGETIPNYQIQASTYLCNNFEIWGNVDWLTKKGSSIGCHSPTRIQVLNFSLGVNYLYPITCCHTFYLGLGPVVGEVWLKNKLSHKSQKVTKTPVGCVIKSGLYYDFTDFIFADLFLDYLYEPVNYKQTQDIGGFKLGLGVGIKF